MNTVKNIKTRGNLRTAICIHGPLIGKRVVSISTGPWMAAGDATAEEMASAASKDAAYQDFWGQAFGDGFVMPTGKREK
jgi:hypothetical protein